MILHADAYVLYGYTTKTVGSAAAAQTRALREYQASSASHSPVWFITFTTLGKTHEAAKLCLTLPKYCKTFDSPK